MCEPERKGTALSEVEKALLFSRCVRICVCVNIYVIRGREALTYIYRDIPEQFMKEETAILAA